MKKFHFLFILLGGFSSFSLMPEKAQSEKPVPTVIFKLLTKHTCLTCHSAYKRVVGPSFLNISKRGYSAQKIAELIAKPIPTNWPGYPPMNPLPNVPFEDVKKIATWINSLE